MSPSDSSSLFIRHLKERHQGLQHAMEVFLATIAGEDSDAKVKASKNALAAAHKLTESLAAPDCPKWLSATISNLQHYDRLPNERKSIVNMLLALVGCFNLMSDEQWSFAESTDVNVFDFDAFYEDYSKQSRLPELFNKIISILEKIIASEEIDSKKLTRTLEELIATLHKNKSGSYFSMRSAWDFTVSLMKNYLWEQLSEIPALGTFVKALKTTMDETDLEIKGLHTQIREVMKKKFASDFPFLTYEANKALPEPEATHTKDQIEQG